MNFPKEIYKVSIIIVITFSEFFFQTCLMCSETHYVMMIILTYMLMLIIIDTHDLDI